MSTRGKPYIHIQCDSVLWTQCVEKASISKWNPPFLVLKAICLQSTSDHFTLVPSSHTKLLSSPLPCSHLAGTWLPWSPACLVHTYSIAPAPDCTWLLLITSMLAPSCLLKLNCPAPPLFQIALHLQPPDHLLLTELLHLLLFWCLINSLRKKEPLNEAEVRWR